MRTRLLLWLSAFVVLGLSTALESHAQILLPTQSTGFLLGPVAGINLVAYNSNSFPIINSEKDCFTAKNGSGIAPWGGFTLEFPLGDINALQNFIVGEVIYDSKSSKFSAENGSKRETPTKMNGFEAPGSVTTSLDAELSYLLLNVAYKYNFTPAPTPIGPGLQVGPSVGIKMAAKLNKTVTVEAISPTATANGQTSQATVSAPTDVTDAQSLRIALRAQFTYDIPFTPTWIATPTVGYDFPVTKVDNTRSWIAQSVFGGIVFRYFLKG
jgi:hypothetical protein